MVAIGREQSIAGRAQGRGLRRIEKLGGQRKRPGLGGGSPGRNKYPAFCVLHSGHASQTSGSGPRMEAWKQSAHESQRAQEERCGFPVAERADGRPGRT